MAILKKIEGDELYLYMNGSLIYKKWLKTGQSKVFDVMAYDKYTHRSITDFDVETNPGVIQIKASLKLYSTNQGGRQTGIRSKYRPNHVFEYENDQFLRTFIGEIDLQDREELLPGEEGNAVVKFLLGQPIEAYLEVGRKWWIHEGARKVGEATITSLV
jgi:translation elongation factor EF-Tu-like GTPase